MMRRVTITLSETERDTVLAALRFWSDQQCEDKALIEIATNGGEHPPLTINDIDALCDRINH